MHATHEIFNQSDPLVDYNLLAGNRALQSALRFNAPGLDTAELQALGAQLGLNDGDAGAAVEAAEVLHRGVDEVHVRGDFTHLGVHAVPAQLIIEGDAGHAEQAAGQQRNKEFVSFQAG